MSKHVLGKYGCYRYGEQSYRMVLGGKVKGLLETGTIASFGASQEFHHVSKRSEQSFFLQSESTCCSYTTQVQFGNLLFFHASTNLTDNHKIFPVALADFDISEVLASFSAFIFSELCPF